MKILRLFCLLVFVAAGAVTSRACDLCGCYTPQLNTMPGMESTHFFPWLAGWYGAVGDQFTRFATVQVDGSEVANPTGQYENSSITQLVAGYQISSRLEEEFHEVEIPGAPESGIHGHDLTLGTGSYDGIFGEQTALRYKNIFFETNIQFTLRGDGTHQYHFANDLVWAGGPGYYIVRNHETIFGVQFATSGEF